jgi:hypothetical protein
VAFIGEENARCAPALLKQGRHMWSGFPLFRSNREYDLMHLQQVRDVIKASRELLANNSVPDTFAGRKAQVPFPEGAHSEVEQWLAPICDSCHVEMGWSRSALVGAEQEISHIFTCPRCAGVAETKTPVKTMG